MRRMVFAVVGLSLVPGLAAAHDTWIRPLEPRVQPGATVHLEATSGMEFPKLEAPIKADRVARAAYRLGGETKKITASSSGKDALGLAFQPNRAGVAVVWLESKSRGIDLKSSEVEEYLTEIGAEDAAREWKAAGKGRWHETYTKHAKTVVVVGESENESDWVKPVGMELEIVPEGDPARLKLGDRVSVRVLRDGKALPGLAVVAQAASEKQSSRIITDPEGRAQFVLNRPGWWLLKATQVQSSPRAAGEWTSHFTTLTVFASEK